MISFQHEPTVVVSDCALTVVTRIRVTKHMHGGMWFFAGSKLPIAVICRSEVGEQILDTDGRHIDAAELNALISDQE